MPSARAEIATEAPSVLVVAKVSETEVAMAGFSIHPRCEVDNDLRFAVVAPDGLCLPLRLLMQGEAEKLASTLNEYLDESEED
jgi:hypothetical protein